jgi:FkbM family methyltransferase
MLSWIGNQIGKPPGWERIVRLIASPEKCVGMADICVVRDGLIFLAQPSVPIGWHVAFFGSYEPELRKIFRAILPAGGVAMDIGANVGWHTLLMARLVGDGGRVYAAEPNTSVRKRLQENLGLNRFGQVEVLPFAIANYKGTATFYGPEAKDADSGNGHVVTNDIVSDKRLMLVETRSLDEIVSDAQVERMDLIKIDVEGFEWPVLQGGQETIARFRPHIVFEYDAEYAARGGGNARAILEFFGFHRYQLFAIGRAWAKAVELESWPDCAEIWAAPVG